VLGLALPASGQPAPDELSQAEFVFVGQVASDKPPVALARPRATTVSVRVDRVLKPQGPSGLAGYKDQTIAVRLRAGSTVAQGATATFYTRIVSLGKVLEVIELGHVQSPAVASRSAQLERATAVAQRTLAVHRRAELERRTAAATVVLSGRVLAVRNTATAGGPLGGRQSEHDPQWSEAVVEVTDVLKGKVANQQVTLRFPSSMDIAWYNAPKFKEGDKGIFLLGKDGAMLSQRVAAPGVQAPVVAQARSFLPIDNLDEVRAAVQRTKQ